jgi:exodeoxyribonuclease VII large subunit
VYQVRGVYQIDVEHFQPLGAGELQIAFERLKQKLSAKGYFDEEHKQPMPFFPQRIGIVTSSTGAALQDIINILSRRCPCIEVILNSVKVQGTGAAEEIAAAIKDFNAYENIDVMIVGRGGGSLEDLWAFNEEIVAKAIYESKIPVISAVGHEIDFTIADFVADLRAPTPSAAAEMVIRTRDEMVDIVRGFHYNLEQSVENILSEHKERIITLLRSYSFNKPIDTVRQHSQRLDELRRSLVRLASHNLILVRQQFSSMQKRMTSANPEAVLHRGYAMVIRDGRVIGASKQLQNQDDVDLKFHDGKVPAKIQFSTGGQK